MDTARCRSCTSLRHQLCSCARRSRDRDRRVPKLARRQESVQCLTRRLCVATAIRLAFRASQPFCLSTYSRGARFCKLFSLGKQPTSFPDWQLTRCCRTAARRCELERRASTRVGHDCFCLCLRNVICKDVLVCPRTDPRRAVHTRTDTFLPWEKPRRVTLWGARGWSDDPLDAHGCPACIGHEKLSQTSGIAWTASLSVLFATVPPSVSVRPAEARWSPPVLGLLPRANPSRQARRLCSGPAFSG